MRPSSRRWASHQYSLRGAPVDCAAGRRRQPGLAAQRPAPEVLQLRSVCPIAQCKRVAICYNEFHPCHASLASLIMSTFLSIRFRRLCRLASLVAASSALAFTFVPSQSFAQTSQERPPNLQKLDESSTGEITIKKPESNSKTVEKREQGVVTDVQVQSGKSNYHLKQSADAGNAAPGDAQSNSVHPAQWQIKEFDWGHKARDAKSGDATQDAAPPPPPAK